MSELRYKYKYIKFVTCTMFPEFEYTCFDKKGNALGFVGYNEKWKEHEYHPNPDTAYTVECHLDIADFLGQLNKEKKHE